MSWVRLYGDVRSDGDVVTMRLLPSKESVAVGGVNDTCTPQDSVRVTVMGDGHNVKIGAVMSAE